MHAKGSRHTAALSRLKERDLSRQAELNKRIALSSDSVTASNNTPSGQVKGAKACNQPLIEQTRKAILEIQSNRSWEQVRRHGSSTRKQNSDDSPCDSKISLSWNHEPKPPSVTRLEENVANTRERSSVVTEAAGKMLVDWNDELRERREKELKFIAAGWKRDGFGKWYRDENVEFDSDEEDPNDSLI